MAGAYKYTVSDMGLAANTEKLLRVLHDMVVSVQSAGNIVVVSL